MSTNLGLSLPRLLPISGTWAAPFTLYYTILSWRIVSERLKSNVYLGDNSAGAKHISPAEPTGSPTPDPLTVAVRCQGNFLENVPLAFIFLVIAELNGGNRKILHYSMATLLALRIAHADLGLRLQGKFGDNGIGRPIGYFGTAGLVIGLAGYASYLCLGYWGF